MIAIARRPRPLIAGDVQAPGQRRALTQLTLGLMVPVMLAAAALGALVLVADPRLVAAAAQRFDARLLVPILLLTIAAYLLQGLRWHLLLRALGASGRVADSELINLAGQTVTAMVPLGDLTRALLASESTGVEFGAAAATVTVQELTFTLLLVLAATPGLAYLTHGAVWMAAVVAGVAAIIAILTVPRVFRVVRQICARTPGVRRLLTQIESLQREVRHLLGRPDVLAGTVLDLGRVIVTTAAMMLVLRGLHVYTLGWWEVALVVAVSYVGGAVSLLPGGVGANEASVVGILVVLGVGPANAAAAAMLQRVSLSGISTFGGLAAYLVVRRRLHLSGLGAIRQLVTSMRAGNTQSANASAQ